MRAQLIPADGTPLEIRRDLTLVGRRKQRPLAAQRHFQMHCVIVKTTDSCSFAIWATNGTRVNGLRIRGAAPPNDQLSIAGFKFRVHLASPAPSSPTMV